MSAIRGLKRNSRRHPGVGFVDEGLALAAQEIKVMGGDSVFEDEIALFFELLLLGVGNLVHESSVDCI